MSFPHPAVTLTCPRRACCHPWCTSEALGVIGCFVVCRRVYADETILFMYSEVGQTASIHDAYDGASLSCYMAPRVPNVPLAAVVSQRLQVESGFPCFGLLGHASLFPRPPSCLFTTNMPLSIVAELFSGLMDKWKKQQVTVRSELKICIPVNVRFINMC